MMKRAAIILSVALLVVVASFLVRHVRRRAHADQCRSQLRLVTILLRGYVTEHGRLPPSVTYDDGTALQSCALSAVQTREYFDFAKHMDASQPWTTRQNRDFFANFDDHSIFHCPSAGGGRGITQYVAIVGPGTAWDPGVTLDDVKDDTLLLVEWPRSDIYWAEPRDITLDELPTVLTAAGFANEHSSSLRYVDWSATVHELPLDASTHAKVRQLALVKAAHPPAK